MVPTVFAQALVERGMLDGAIAGVSSVFTEAGQTIAAHPYVAIGTAVVLMLVLLRRR